ncbi:malonate decarboxylase subunit epsilon [Duganella sp. BJB488]|uniref:malonate decarboxylase subunit epsilon n=1 Tax=unclassified Duganella TaxID=2636909 RepID=UPI000E341BC1|nr:MULTISPECIES: malonate decarboxylase subunit epsilon [unclassified Duganella]RFP09174.1 malonate decarboxylase subunit epsilon [Duganella sp. BJB475]RFP13252.1 malonate decarboxylase subunit epsilon [Duganella sp. BJB489]RFP17172.1 malonate decarboxylase subunit epsilon [Duganella sp. BJB488]RFP25400.1 malonate decarboxylase subunit epsilon [Duganella sp. BJB476]RFP31607.1 malonate decarboxylase subunit epsilon [Duganella sp. BJB480]
MSILFTFPGQGAQRPGMLHALPSHPEVLRTLDESAAVLAADPLNLDTQEALASTVAVQLCLLIAGVAMARTLIAHGAFPDMVAGLSIGAYPAAVIAGSIDHRDAVKLVARRARLMESAFPYGHGMAAITGLDRYQLEPLIACTHSASTPVYLANLNAHRQMVIAGADAAMQTVMRLAVEHGASKVERLAVNVPSHCPLFEMAAEEMRSAFRDVTLQQPSAVYLSSSAARALRDPARIAEDLAGNMAHQVDWSETAQLAWESGARLAVEMPSGSVLTKLTTSAFADGLTICCDNLRIDTVLALIADVRGSQ